MASLPGVHGGSDEEMPPIGMARQRCRRRGNPDVAGKLVHTAHPQCDLIDQNERARRPSAGVERGAHARNDIFREEFEELSL